MNVILYCVTFRIISNQYLANVLRLETLERSFHVVVSSNRILSDATRISEFEYRAAKERRRRRLAYSRSDIRAVPSRVVTDTLVVSANSAKTNLRRLTDRVWVELIPYSRGFRERRKSRRRGPALKSSENSLTGREETILRVRHGTRRAISPRVLSGVQRR